MLAIISGLVIYATLRHEIGVAILYSYAHGASLAVAHGQSIEQAT